MVLAMPGDEGSCAQELGSTVRALRREVLATTEGVDSSNDEGGDAYLTTTYRLVPACVLLVVF